METAYATFDKPAQRITHKFRTDILNTLYASNVGIGVTTPAAKLHVAGDIRADEINATVVGFSNVTSSNINTTTLNAETVTTTQDVIAGDSFICNGGLALRSMNAEGMRLQAQLGAFFDVVVGGYPRLKISPTGTITLFRDTGETPFHCGSASTFDQVMNLKEGANVLANKVVQFGSDVVGRDGAAGQVGYGVYSDALDIVGAGTANGNRKVKIWENLETSNVTLTGLLTTPAVQSASRPVVIKPGLASGVVDLKLFLCAPGDANTAGLVGNEYGGTAGIPDLSVGYTTFQIPRTSGEVPLINNSVQVGLYNNKFKLFNTTTGLFETRTVRYNLFSNYGIDYNFMAAEWWDEIEVDGLTRAILQINCVFDDDAVLYVNGAPVFRSLNSSVGYCLVPVGKRMDFQLMVINRSSGGNYTATQFYLDYRVVTSW